MNKICIIENCGRPVRSRNMCTGHAERHRLGKRGDELTTPLKHHPKKGEGKGCIGKNGYFYISVDGKKKLYHRILMEKHLGRPLLPSEHIHHIDENPLNNVIDNLAIVSHQNHCRLFHKTHDFFCSIKGCESRLAQEGLCSMHLKRLRRRGDTFPEIPKTTYSHELRNLIPEILKTRKLGDWYHFLREDGTFVKKE